MITETRSGKVEGIEREGVCVFRGIPYATPPVGPRRWLAPERESAWDGVRDAAEFSPASAQSDIPLASILGGAQGKSEDSLYLNVYTPACDDARRPVMVWIHGGAFVMGSGDTPWYDGTKFCRNGDVVVVTLNYRLGAFGFVHLADLFGAEFEGSGNNGILDQIAALEWVRDSIAAFGGNPDDVTLFGESAGAGSTGTLLGCPAARGLFRKAILQSGASSWWAPREDATGFAQKIIDKLGVRAGDIDALRAVPMAQIIEAQVGLGQVGSTQLPFQPVVDGTVLPRPPLETVEAGNAAGVPVLLGSNRHEMTLFNFLDASLASADDAAMTARLSLWHPDAARVLAEYRSRRPDVTPLDLWTDLASDAVFRQPVNWLAETQTAHSPVWLYLFTWETPAFGGALKSTHAVELPFVFDNLDQPGSDFFTGDGAERQAIADAMHRAWIAFARTGDPNHPGLPQWPQYDLDRRPAMRFDTTCEVLDDPLGDDRRSWDGHRR